MIGMLSRAPANAYNFLSSDFAPALISQADRPAGQSIDQDRLINKSGWPESLLEPTSVLDNYNIIIGSPSPSSTSSSLLSSTSSSTPTATTTTNSSGGSGSFISSIDIHGGISSAVAVEGRPTDDHVNGNRGTASGEASFRPEADKCETAISTSWQPAEESSSMRHRSPWVGTQQSTSSMLKKCPHSMVNKDELTGMATLRAGDDGVDENVVADGSLEACVMSGSYNYSRVRKRDRGGGEEEENILGEVVHTRPARSGVSHGNQKLPSSEKVWAGGTNIVASGATEWPLNTSSIMGWNHDQLYNPQVTVEADPKLLGAAGGQLVDDDLDEIFVGAAPEYILSSELLNNTISGNNNSWPPRALPPQESQQQHQKQMLSSHVHSEVGAMAISANHQATGSATSAGAAAQLDLYEAMQVLYRSGGGGASGSIPASSSSNTITTTTNNNRVINSNYNNSSPHIQSLSNLHALPSHSQQQRHHQIPSQQPHEFGGRPFNSTRPYAVHPFGPLPYNLIIPTTQPPPSAFNVQRTNDFYAGQPIQQRNLMIDPANPPFSSALSNPAASSSSSACSHMKFAPTTNYSTQVAPPGSFNAPPDALIKRPWLPNIVEHTTAGGSGSIATRAINTTNDPSPSMLMMMTMMNNSIGQVNSVHPGHRPPLNMAHVGGHGISSNNLIVGRCVRLDELSLAEHHLSSAARAAAHGDLVTAQAILARLNQQQTNDTTYICSPTASSSGELLPFHNNGLLSGPKLGQPRNYSPSHWTVFHFREAFTKRLLQPSSSLSPWNSSNMSSTSYLDHIINKMSAYKSFFDASLIPQFAHFTANQAILDALGDGENCVHIIDFELGFAGGQWASFMQEFVQRSAKSGRPAELKITTLVADDNVGLRSGESLSNDPSLEIRLARENLFQFANEVGLKLEVDVIPFRKLRGGVLTNDSGAGAVVVNFGLYGGASSIDIYGSDDAMMVSELFQCIRRLKPRVVTVAESEINNGARNESALLESLQFYACVFESLHESGKGITPEAMFNIESTIFGPEIAQATKAYVDGAHQRSARPGPGPGPAPPQCTAATSTRVLLQKAGFSPLQFSTASKSQASCLVKNSGFSFTKLQERLVLGWYNKPLISASAWV